MSARRTNYMQAIEHLPAGALLVFQSVGWEEYEQVLEDLVDRPGIRATYDRGRLENKVKARGRNARLPPSAGGSASIFRARQSNVPSNEH